MFQSTNPEDTVNAFEALCVIASKENWCWNLMCTTCGHMYFRYAFLELLKGRHPHDPIWITKKCNHHQLPSLLGDLRRVNQLSFTQQEILAEIFASASLLNISKLCRFPDWLGYLGLALRYTEKAEHSTRVLTQAWSTKLLDLVSPGSKSAQFLNSLVFNDGILTWGNLEMIEKELAYSS